MSNNLPASWANDSLMRQARVNITTLARQCGFSCIDELTYFIQNFEGEIDEIENKHLRQLMQTMKRLDLLPKIRHPIAGGADKAFD